MLRSRELALFFCTLRLSSSISAQAPKPPIPGTPAPSIAIVDFNNAVLGTDEAQRALNVLEKKYYPREQQLKKLNDDVETTKKVLNDSTTKLTDSERNQRIQDLSTKEKQLQRQAEDLKNDSQSDSQQIFQGVAQKVYMFLQDYAQQHAYSAVVERGTDAAPVVWYAANNMDITDQLIKAYNLKSVVGPTSLPDKPAASHSEGVIRKNP